MKFIPQRKNANRHTLHGTRLLEKSITTDGFIDAQTAAADGEIISGSARLELSAEKFADVEPIVIESDGTRPVIVVRTDIPNLDDPRARRLSVAANQIAKTDYNPDGELLKEWGGEDEQIRALFADSEWTEITGEEKPTKDAEPQIDRAAELLEKWQVQTGDLWQIGEHRLICGDCTDAATVARVMGGEKADCVMTDPPYGMNLDTDFTGMPETRIASKTYDKVEGDDKDFDAAPFIAMFDYVKEQFYWGGDYFYTSLPLGGSWIVWDKRNENSDGLVGNHFEVCWSRTPHRRRMIRVHWSGVNARNQGTKREHPTEKSIKVLSEILGDYTKDNQIILDFFAGVGTTLVACQNLGRRSRAIEISPAYVAVTLERMATAFPELEIKRL